MSADRLQAVRIGEVKRLENRQPRHGALEAEPHSGTGQCGNDGEERRSHHSEKFQANLIARLNRIEGQVRGIKGMIERQTYCDDVLNQIAAIQSALNGVGKLLLEGHMKSCVVERIEEGDKDVLDELLKTINKLIK